MTLRDRGSPRSLSSLVVLAVVVLIGVSLALLLFDPRTTGADALRTGGLAAGSVVALYALWLNDRRRRVEEKRQELLARGIEVTEVVDHDWAKSIYFKDPNGLQLEFCCFTRNLNADDAHMQDRFELSVKRLGLADPAELSSAGRTPASVASR